MACRQQILLFENPLRNARPYLGLTMPPAFVDTFVNLSFWVALYPALFGIDIPYETAICEDCGSVFRRGVDGLWDHFVTQRFLP